MLVMSQDRGMTWNTDQSVTLPFDGLVNNLSLYFGHKKDDHIYMVNSGQVITSPDQGKTWTKCGQTPLTGTTQTLLAIDPRDSTHIFLATQGQGVAISSDGCQTWSASLSGISYPYINTLLIDPQNPDILYAGTDAGIFVSGNSGKTWDAANEGLLNNPIIYSMAFDLDKNILYAATPYGIFKLGKK
jgi:photosystem II stability/assembly factor-like uncharacterized protein